MKSLRVWALVFMPLAFAQADMPRNEITLAGGIATAIQDNAIHLKNSFDIEAAYYRRLLPWGALGLESGFFLGGKYSGIAPQGVDTDGNGQLDAVSFEENAFGATFRLTPQIKLGPLLESGGVRWLPYVAGGGGFYGVFFASTRSRPESVPVRSGHGGYNYGGGLTVFFPGGFGVGADFRWHHVIDRGAPDASYRVPSLHLSLLF